MHRRGKITSLLAAVVLLGLSAAGPITVAGDDRGDDRVVPAHPDYDAPAAREARRKAIDQSERRRQRRATPEARENRRRSRGAYREMSRHEALELARRQFPGALEERAWQPLSPKVADRVIRFLDDNTALVDTGSGTRDSMLESTVPLRSDLGSGRDEPASLELEEHGAAFEPENPVVPTRIPKDLREGIDLGDGVSLEPEGAPSTEPLLTDDKLFWANVATDTDLTVRPAPTGVQLFLQVRSADAPEAFRLEFDLPDGARLSPAERGPDGAVEVRRDGKRLAYVAPPTSEDADGEPVETRLTVEGNTAVVRYSHRAGDYAYPLLVDPVYQGDIMDDVKKPGFPNWAGPAVIGPAGPGLSHLHGSIDPNLGIWEYLDYPFADYVDGQRVEYQWKAQGTTRIDEVDLNADHDMHTTCQVLGVYGYGWEGDAMWHCPPGGGYNQRHHYHCISGNWIDQNGNPRPDPPLFTPPPANTYCQPIGGINGNYAIYTLWIYGSGPRNVQDSSLLRDTQVWSHDWTQPYLLPFNEGSKWVPEGFHSIQPTAEDAGFGVKSMRLTKPLAAGGTATQVQLNRDYPGSGGAVCVGSWALPCHATWRGSNSGPTKTAWTPPATGSTRFEYTTDDMPEGQSTLRLESEDATGSRSNQPGAPTPPAGRVKEATWGVKVDRSQPLVPTTSGSMSDGTVAPTKGWVRDGVYTLDVTQRDVHSGVRTSSVGVGPNIVSDDTFNRTQSGGWGSGTKGGDWTTEGGPASDWSVAPATGGRFNFPVGSGFRFATQFSTKVRDTDYKGSITFRQPTTGTGSGAASYGYLTLRRTQGGPYYRVGLASTTTNALMLFGLNGNGTDLFAPFDTGLGNVVGRKYWLRVQAEGASPTTIRVKAWKDGDPEPAAWTRTVSDTGGPHTAGSVGVRVNGGSTSAQQVDFDDLQATDMPPAPSVRNGTKPDGTGTTCDATTGCATTLVHPTVTWDTTGDAEGVHDIALSANDPLYDGSNGAKHLRTKGWPVKLDRTRPDFATAGDISYANRDRWFKEGTYSLIVNGSDTPSGVSRTDFRVNNTPQGTDPGTCDANQCNGTDSATFQWNSEGTGDTPSISVDTVDVPGNVDDPATHPDWAIKMDRDKPTVAPPPSGTLSRRGGSIGFGSQDLHVTANDPKSGVERIEAFVDDADDPNDTPESIGAKDGTCTPTGCGPALTGDFTWDSTGGPDRVNVTLDVRDQAGNEYTDTWDVHLDDAPPELTLSGALRPPVATGRNLHMKGDDADTGIKQFLVWVDPDDDPTENEAAHVKTYECSPSCNHVEEEDWALPVATPEGQHEILVRVLDETNLQDEERYDVHVINLLPASRSKLGLEHFFQYDDTPAGGSSNVYVNAETGNTVWHSVPIVDPGRGLSTAVNLTYNSHDRGGIAGSTLGRVPIVDTQDANINNELPGLSFAEAGVGFSLGISGPTRLNEPLGNVLIAQALDEAVSIGEVTAGHPLPTPIDNNITMTDADGTVHTFTRGTNGEWISPPGVRMRLRRYRDGGTWLTPIPDKWAMTRPDGVTHFFDSQGYLTSTEDRNGNKLAYHYEYYDALTGDVAKTVSNGSGGTVDVAICDGIELGHYTTIDVGPLANTPVYCAKRVDKVIDPAGRELKIDYRDHDGNLLGLGDGELPVEMRADFPGLTGGKAGRIDKITDHRGREYAFEYDDHGYLTRFREAAGTPEERETVLRYEEWGTFPTQFGQDRQLTEVVENAGASSERRTVLRHEHPDDHGALPRPPGILATPRRACGVTPRNDSETLMTPQPVSGHACRTRRSDREKTYEYEEPEGSTPRQFVVDEILNRAQPGGSSTVGTTRTELDSLGRPTLVEDPEHRETALTWNDDENAVASVEEAHDSPDASLTELTYDSTHDTGVITEKRTYPDYNGSGDKGTPRTTQFYYQFSNGVHHSEATGVDDSTGGWVADLTEIRNPRSGTGQSFEIRQDPANGNYLGNVTKRWGKPGRIGEFAQTFYDDLGRITSETDEMLNVTLYDDFHATGQPQQVTDPRGKVWNYRYDEVGNVTSVVDPRASDRSGDPNAAHTTTLTYDAFDRLTNEKIPKLSAGSDPGERFRTESRTFDRNGNVLTSTDGAGNATQVAYTPMDQPRRVTAPGRAGRPEVTDYSYDDADRLIARVDPKGTGASAPAVGDQVGICKNDAAAPATPYMTRYCLDDAGQRVAEVRSASSGDLQPGEPTTLLTSFAFDGRDNLVGTVDPRRNVGRSVSAAITAAQDGDEGTTTRRMTYRYDKVDERIWQIEHPTEAPGGTRAAPMRTKLGYDANGNRTSMLPPRAFENTVESAPDTAFETRTFYDHRDEQVAVRTPSGCTAYERRADGKVTAVTSPRGTESLPDDCSQGGPYTHFTTKYAYDANGDLTSRSVPYAPHQYGRDDSEFADWKVTYTRDDVGNPETIRDARGHDIHNTFYDGGELRTTDRPSFFQLKWEDDYETNDPARRFKEDEERLGPDLELADGGPQLEEADGRSRNAERSDEDPERPEGEGHGNFGEVKRNELGDLLPDAGTTTLTYDGEMRLTGIEDAADNDRTIDYDGAGRVIGKSWPFKPGSPIEHEFEYDLNGNLEGYTDGRGSETTFANDGYDRRGSETTPGASPEPGDPVAPETTAFSYDANGNLARRQTPRAGHAFQFAYDSVDRLTSETNPADESWDYQYDAGRNPTVEHSPRWHTATAEQKPDFETTFEYDTSDRLERVHRGLGDEFDVEYGYDAEGNQTSVTSPGSASSEGGSASDRKKATEYDGRGLPWRESTSSAGGDDRRTQIKEYDPNGNLRRIVNGKGIDSDTRLPKVDDDPGASTADVTWHATLREYDDDDQITAIRLPWSTSGSPTHEDPSGPSQAEAGGDERRFVQEFVREGDPLRRITSIVSPHQSSADVAPRTSYTYFSNGWTKTQSDEKLVDPDTNSRIGTVNINFNFDKTGNQTSWKTKNAGDNTKGREIVRRFYPNGTLERRTAYKPSPSGDGDCEDDDTDCESARHYEYFYNPNRSLTEIDDFDPELSPEGSPPPSGTPDRRTEIDRDAAEREHVVDETWGGGRDTVFDYDANGNVTRRKTDGAYHSNDQSYDGDDAKVTTFQYDELDRETELVVDPAEGGNRTTTTTWWDSGDMRVRTKPNGTVETRFYNPRGEISSKTRNPDEGATQTQDYDYDRDGNRTEDERGQHLFNARGELVRWTRGAKYSDHGKQGTVVEYTRNGSGDVTRREDSWQPEGVTGATVTTNDYRGERLWKSTVSRSTEAGSQSTISRFFHDDFGSVTRIDTEFVGAGEEPGEDPPDGPDAPASCAEMPSSAEAHTTRYCFDEFERMVASRGQGIEHPTNYVYDGLDRRDKKTTIEDGDPKTHDYSYIGTSEMLSRETDTKGKRKSYDYDSDGRRLGQSVRKPDDPAPTFRPYAVDANGSVEGLEDANGGFGTNDQDTYLYDPYGESEKVDEDPDETEDPGLSEDAKDNPFRFEGFYFDSGVKTYDMGARSYRPDVGRFLSQDRYESAIGDQLLQADPLTQNRYAFAGGNPVNNVEFDGHWASLCAIGKCRRRGGGHRRVGASRGRGVAAVVARARGGGIRVDVGTVPTLASLKAISVVVNPPPPLLSFPALSGNPRGVPRLKRLQDLKDKGSQWDRLRGYPCGYIGLCFGNQDLEQFQVGRNRGDIAGWIGVKGAERLALRLAGRAKGEVDNVGRRLAGLLPGSKGTAVYHAKDDLGMVRYVGITRDIEARGAAHLRERGIVIQRIRGLPENLTRRDARNVEQALIVHYGLGSRGGTLLNRINSISALNPFYAYRLQRGRDLLRRAGYPGFP